MKERNADAVIIAAPWDELTGDDILSAMEHRNSLDNDLAALAEEHKHHHHHHHHDDDDECDDEECSCHHHHDDDDDDEDEHEHHHHHHHDDDDDEEEHEHHHHDDDDDEEHEHHHHHHHHDDDDDDEEEHEHHHHHHADEVFTSVGIETTKKFTEAGINEILKKLDNTEEFGIILRAKGIVAAEEGEWIHFDYVPEESDIRRGSADVIGKICVIGSKINEDNIKALF